MASQYRRTIIIWCSIRARVNFAKLNSQTFLEIDSLFSKIPDCELKIDFLTWGRSSDGRAREWHSRGRGFDPHRLHKKDACKNSFFTKLGRPKKDSIDFSFILCS